MAKRQQFRLRSHPTNHKQTNLLNTQNNVLTTQNVLNTQGQQNIQKFRNSQKLMPVTLEIPKMDYLKVPEQNVEIKARIVPVRRPILNSTLQGSIEPISEETEYDLNP